MTSGIHAKGGTEAASEMVRRLMRETDGDTRVAVLRLAELFDAHMQRCGDR